MQKNAATVLRLPQAVEHEAAANIAERARTGDQTREREALGDREAHLCEDRRQPDREPEEDRAAGELHQPDAERGRGVAAADDVAQACGLVDDRRPLRHDRGWLDCAEAAHDRGRAWHVVACDQEAHRLRQSQPHQHEHEGWNRADHEHAAPCECGHHQNRGERCEEARSLPEEHARREQNAAATGRHEFGEIGEDERHFGAEPDALQNAQAEQRRVAPCACGQQAEQTVPDDRGGQRPFAPEAIGHHADQDRTGEHADEHARCEHARLRRLQRERRHDARQDEAHHVDIEAVEEMA